MASVKDLGQVIEDLGNLVDEARSELRSGPDFERLIQVLDEISEHADNAAGTFSAMNDALMSRIGELQGKSSGSSRKSDGSSSQSREKTGAAS